MLKVLQLGYAEQPAHQRHRSGDTLSYVGQSASTHLRRRGHSAGRLDESVEKGRVLVHMVRNDVTALLDRSAASARARQ